MSTVINESSKTTLECALRCDYSGKETDKFSKRGYKIQKIILFALWATSLSFVSFGTRNFCSAS